MPEDEFGCCFPKGQLCNAVLAHDVKEVQRLLSLCRCEEDVDDYQPLRGRTALMYAVIIGEIVFEDTLDRTKRTELNVIKSSTKTPCLGR